MASSAAGRQREQSQRDSQDVQECMPEPVFGRIAPRTDHADMVRVDGRGSSSSGVMMANSVA
jgi:hypothetical protein